MPLIEVNSTNIHYVFDGPGEGPVVMLSNALASDLTMWGAQVPALVEAGYRVLRYDSRGHGRSAVPEGSYSMQVLADDAKGLMDALDLERVHFCGLSKGGMVGQMLGAQHESRLISLVLSSTSAHMPPPEAWDGRMAAVRKDGMQAVADATIDRWFTGEGRRRLPAEVEKIRQILLRTPVEGFCACCAAIRDMDQRETIGAISTRTLVVVGEQDMGTPVSASEFIHERIGPSELRVVSGAAHFVNVEKAGVFNEALLNFLQKSAA